jgi:ribosomal protein S12 methylthiotransferase accessory factor
MAALDYWSTVQPAAGLVRGLTVLPPNGDTHLLWSVAADIGQQDWSGARLSADDYQLTLVGACGVERADAFIRGSGEAVERAALLPIAPLADDRSAPALAAGALWSGEPFAHGAYAATELATGRARRVPAPAVDYPVPDEDVLGRFDVTPSGAAAGPTHADAVAAAAREVLERDAAMIAWARQARLPRLDLRTIARGSRPLAKVLEVAGRAGLEPVAAVAPTAVAGTDCVIGVVIDREARIAAAGLAVGDPAKAISEALQVRSVLLGVARHYKGADVPAAVASDIDRARVWTAPRALETMERWLAGLGPPLRERSAGSSIGLDGVAIVDLTPRLPQPIRDLGWHAVKALAPQHQPLRMSELHAWSWNHERLAAPERDWGVDCLIPAGQVEACPHPFI